MRSYVCKNPSCKAVYTKQKPGQKVCSIACAIEFAKIEKMNAIKKADRKDYRAKKEALKTRREWLNESQAVFNSYIRARDYLRPCISCGNPNANSWDAGHYRSVGAAPGLRFNEDNVHKQCVACNQHKSGNAIEYRIGLKARIGEERVDALECFNEVVKWSIEDAKRIKAEYKAKLKELTNERR